MWRSLSLLLATISTVSSLTCYICGDSNLDEFGECAKQFQYDCSSYAARFSPTERIFCRTTRQRAKNATYTVMKECISERDHLRSFPDKGYPLDDECDLVDVRGEEVAYCICRNAELCNKAPIAEQFMAFEQEHPELFGDIEETTPLSLAKAPLAFKEAPIAFKDELPAASFAAPPAAFGAPQIAPPAIVPINDPRFKTSDSEVRRQQLPSREDIAVVTDNTRTTKGESKHRALGESQGLFVGSMGPRPVSAVAVKPNAIKPTASHPLPPPTTEAAHGLKCVQCGETGLTADGDCAKQVLTECANGQVCFTRSITLTPGMFAVEKTCATSENLRFEFPGAGNDTCGTSNGGRVRYCTCSSEECNRESILEQMGRFVPAIEPQQNEKTHHLPDLADPQLPVIPINSVKEEPKMKLPPLLEPRMPLPPTSARKPQVIESLDEVPHPPAFPTPEELQQAVQPVPAIASNSNVKKLRCSVCSEAMISDPMADCSSQASLQCDASHQFCLTQQTNNNGLYSMEKRCLAATELRKLGVKGTGCKPSQGGDVNFCVCSGDNCNQAPLIEQANIIGIPQKEVAKPQEPIRPTASSIPLPKEVQQAAPVERENEETKPLRELFTDAPQDEEMSEEAKRLEERQKQWTKDMTASSSLASLAVPLLLSICYLFF